MIEVMKARDQRVREKFFTKGFLHFLKYISSIASSQASVIDHVTLSLCLFQNMMSHPLWCQENAQKLWTDRHRQLSDIFHFKLRIANEKKQGGQK
jgi:hypothetical protein